MCMITYEAKMRTFWTTIIAPGYASRPLSRALELVYTSINTHTIITHYNNDAHRDSNEIKTKK